MQEVIEGLTGELTEEDLKGLSFDRNLPRLLAPDTEDNLQRLFVENHWTDCLPIVLPTEARVARRCSRAPAIRRTRWSDGCGRPLSANSGSSRSRRWR